MMSTSLHSITWTLSVHFPTFLLGMASLQGTYREENTLEINILNIFFLFFFTEMNQNIAFRVCIFRKAHSLVQQITHANLLRTVLSFTYSLHNANNLLSKHIGYNKAFAAEMNGRE